MNTYELWHFDDSVALWPVPNHRRIHQLSEAGATLTLRITAHDWEDAKRQKDLYLYDDNPAGLIPLNIPAKEFFVDSYRCGLRVGDVLEARMEYALIADEYLVGTLPPGTRMRVSTGDSEYPEWIFVSFEGLNQKIERFEIHERDILSNELFEIHPKAQQGR